MRSLSRFIGSMIFVTAGLLSACSSSAALPSNIAGSGGLPSTITRGQRARPVHVSGWIRRVDAISGLAYVSDAFGFVDIFTRDGTLQGQLTGFTQPGGIFVDGAHNLWVADTSAVYEFPRGSTQPSKTLSDPVGSPDDVTMCPDGTVYVSNSTSSFPPAGMLGLRSDAVSPDAARGSIEVYPPGTTSPTRYLQFADQLTNWFVTCDARGNVFTTLLYGPSTSAVIEYVHGRGRGTLLPIPGFSLGIKADSGGNILVGPGSNPNTITEYTEAGSPTGVSITTGSGEIQQFALARSGSVIGAADSQNKHAASWTFPGGAPKTTYSDPNFNYPSGFAFDPPAPR